MKREAGFTLVELIGAVAIIGVLAVVSVPYLLGNLHDYRVNGATRQVLGDMRLARAAAVDNGLRVFVKFHEPGKDAYTIFLDDGDNILDVSTDKAISEVDLASLFKGVELATFDPAATSQPSYRDGVTFGHNSTATFKPIGTSDTGSVYLRPSVDGGSGREDRQRRVKLQGSTGRVRIEAWEKGSWN